MSQKAQERRAAAIDAVRAAAVVCRNVQENLIEPETLEKRDKSPVTVADFASQAIICAKLADTFPNDLIIGEEDAHELREDAQEALRQAVVNQVQSVLGEQKKEAAILADIDRGAFNPEGQTSYWTLDPIDGTKGFLRKEQYAIALALIEDGQVTLGVLGCPNLQTDQGAGALLVAVAGQGTQLLPLWKTDQYQGQTINVSKTNETCNARFCESVESGHSDHGQAAIIAKKLSITESSVRMDSQAKYATVARGQAEIYLRLPTSADYREKIWDHAAGMICMQEAGGKVTDAAGKLLNFSLGRMLTQNQGIIATNGQFHDQVVAAVQSVLKAV